MKELIQRDHKILQKLLKRDFAENLIGLIVLSGSLIFGSTELLEGGVILSVTYLSIAYYIYCECYGSDGNKVHEIRFEDKVLTSSISTDNQSNIANNLSLFLNENNIKDCAFDNWELEKIRLFLENNKLDNPVAFLISDIYEKSGLIDKAKCTNAEKQNDSDTDFNPYIKDKNLEELWNEDSQVIIDKIESLVEKNVTAYQNRMEK